MNTDNKFTPGEWIASYDIYLSRNVILNEANVPIIVFNESKICSFEVSKANCTLVSAAPDMLAALVAWSEYHNSDMSEVEKELLAKTRAAIDKATKQQ